MGCRWGHNDVVKLRVDKVSETLSDVREHWEIGSGYVPDPCRRFSLLLGGWHERNACMRHLKPLAHLLMNRSGLASILSASSLQACMTGLETDP